MRIEIVADDSISPQARMYAEYRLFAALSQAVDTGLVRSASLELRRGTSKRRRDAVFCRVTIEFRGGEVSRLRASGDHPYAAINSAVERLRPSSRPVRHESSPLEMAATE